jgi:hypothetical protein
MKVGRKMVTTLTIWVLLFSVVAALSKNSVSEVSSHDGERAYPYHNLDFLRTAALSQEYNYTRLNTPFNDMKIEFTVHPNATVLISGSTNHTQIDPNYRQYQPLINASLGLSTIGDTTMGSLNGRLSIPEYNANEFPFNSTTMNYASTYENGMLNDQLNATMLMPPAGSTTYPFNSSDFRLLGTYSERTFSVDLYGRTVFSPVITSQLPFNVSDLTVLAEYKNGVAKGNITFHTVSGFPLGDVILHFNGSRTELSLTGHVNVIYGDYSGTTINETVLEDTLFRLNSTIPGRGEGSLYNMTQGIIECTNLNTIKTPLGGPLPGARVDYSATIGGNSTELIAKLLTQMFFGSWASEETHSIVYAAFDAALSSVDYASLELNYFYGSRFGSIHIKLISDVKELWSNALVLVPPVVPPENRSQVEAWLKIANITAFAVKNVYLNVDYSSTEQRLSLNASRTINSTELEDEMLPLLPDAVPPQLRDWVQSFTNTTFCRLDSYNATCNYANGIASFDAKWILKGDFTAELNHVKRCYIELLNMTSPWVMDWHLEMLSASEVDLGNLKLELRQGGDWETISFQGIKVQTVKDDIDSLRFRLYRFFNMTGGSYESPRNFEKLKVTVNAGFNGTHTLLLYAQGAMPNPSATSLDYKSMTWENVTISSLKDLLFKIAYQGVINYAGQTFYVPIFTNSTVGSFGFDAGTKQMSFGVAGTTGTGFCNITIPRALLYAAPSEWVITMNGTALTPGSFNVTENDGYVFIYLPYSHSTHLIQIQGTWIITEFPPNMFPLILTILSFIAVVVAVKERRRLNKMRMKYRSSLRAFVSKLYLTKS